MINCFNEGPVNFRKFQNIYIYIYLNIISYVRLYRVNIKLFNIKKPLNMIAQVVEWTIKLHCATVTDLVERFMKWLNSAVLCRTVVLDLTSGVLDRDIWPCGWKGCLLSKYIFASCGQWHTSVHAMYIKQVSESSGMII